MWGEEKYQVLLGKPEGRSPFGTARSRWENNIKMYFREMRWDGADWSHLAQDRGKWRVLVTTVMDFEPLKMETTCSFETSGTTYPATHPRHLESTAMNLRVPWNAGNFLTSGGTISFLRRPQFSELVSDWRIFGFYITFEVLHLPHHTLPTYHGY
jgi:hypothetical protein